MPDPVAREPHRPLIWPDLICRLRSAVAGEDRPVYIVGGAVRDALPGRPVHDIDLAVADGGIRLARRIGNALQGDFFALDRERDVGRALLRGEEGQITVDVAAFRGPDLPADLADRDFTVNAMAVELAGDCDRLIDPLGGEADLRAKVLRQCGPRSLSDDPLRALRALRLAAQFGFRIEAQTLSALRTQCSQLSNVSPERLRDEFWRMLALPRAAAALRAAAATGVLEAMAPELAALRHKPAGSEQYEDAWQETLAVVDRLQRLVSAFGARRDDQRGASFGVGMLVMQLDRWRPQLQGHMRHAWPDARAHPALLTLAALYCLTDREGDAATALARARALRLSNAECERIRAVLELQREPLQLDSHSDLALYRFWRRAGEAGLDACLLAAARALGEAGLRLRHEDWLVGVDAITRVLQARFERRESLLEPPPLLDGHALMSALGLTPGPTVGALLEHLREAQATGRANTREEALAEARAWLGKRAWQDPWFASP